VGSHRNSLAAGAQYQGQVGRANSRPVGLTSLCTPGFVANVKPHISNVPPAPAVGDPTTARGNGMEQARMPRYLPMATLGIALMSVGACVNHTYAPGPGMSATDQGPDAARCRLYARGTRPSMAFEASGSQKAVAIESGVALGLGVVGTLVHDSETYDDCMQARGWLVADEAAAASGAAQQPAATTGVVPQPVSQAQLPPLAMAPVAPVALLPPPVISAREEQAARAEIAAEAWFEAERTMNEPGGARDKELLYTVLCNAGDRSSCLMAVALNRPVRYQPVR
jgi:hypothetical protein